jgi:hypothetical protein
MNAWTPAHRDAALQRVERMTAGAATVGVLTAAALGYLLAGQAQAAEPTAPAVAPAGATVSGPTAGSTASRGLTPPKTAPSAPTPQPPAPAPAPAPLLGSVTSGGS